MKNAISIWAMGDLAPREAIPLAARLGFDAIELALNEEGPLGLDVSEKELAEYRTLATDNGIALRSVATGLYWSYNFASADASKAKKASAVCRKQLDVAAALGADTILVVPGMVGSLDGTGEIVPYDRVWDRSLEAIATLIPDAKAAGVAIGLENVWNKFLLSPLEMRAFIDALGSPWVGAYFDVGNVLQSGYPEHWIRILGSRIKKVHFKDFKCAIGGLDGFVDLLEGDVNFPEVMKALHEIGYADTCTAEVFPAAGPFLETELKCVQLAMKAILEK